MNELILTETYKPSPESRTVTNRWLVGDDDGARFEVKVPMRIRTVADAIAWLRPGGIPEDCPRQGEFFFLPMGSVDEWIPSDEAGEEQTGACSYRRTEVTAGPEYYGHHRVSMSPDMEKEAAETGDTFPCSAELRSGGDTAFICRDRVRSHSWTGRPRYFVRGQVTHPQHKTLVLGWNWYEIIPNRAHGPWPVDGSIAGSD